MKQRFYSLDALRGIASLGIVYFHLRPQYPGFLLVELFLLISGFVIAQSIENSSPEAIKQFPLRRMIRLLPLNVFCLIFFLFGNYLLYHDLPKYGDATYWVYFSHFFLLHNLGMNEVSVTLNYPAWTLSCEIWISIGCAAIISGKTRSGYILAAAMLCFLIVAHNFKGLDVNSHNWGILNLGTTRCLGSFLLGWLAYRAHKSLIDRANIHLETLIQITLIAAIYFFIFSRPSNTSSMNDFVAPFLFFGLIISLARNNGLALKFLTYLEPIGRISFSIYLTHIPLLSVFDTYTRPTHLSDQQKLSIYFAVLLPTSTLTYLLIEKYASKYLTNLLLPRKENA